MQLISLVFWKAVFKRISWNLETNMRRDVGSRVGLQFYHKWWAITITIIISIIILNRQQQMLTTTIIHLIQLKTITILVTKAKNFMCMIIAVLFLMKWNLQAGPHLFKIEMVRYLTSIYPLAMQFYNWMSPNGAIIV